MSFRRRVLGCLAVLLLCAPGCAEEEGDDFVDTGRDGAILRYQTTFGECSGRCVTEITFTSSTVRLKIRDHDGTAYEENTGILTSSGLSQARIEVVKIADEQLEQTYGCPDCADGGATGATIRRDNVESSHLWETGNPPNVLKNLDTFVQGLQTALTTCASTDVIDVNPNCIVVTP